MSSVYPFSFPFHRKIMHETLNFAIDVEKSVADEKFRTVLRLLKRFVMQKLVKNTLLLSR